MINSRSNRNLKFQLSNADISFIPTIYLMVYMSKKTSRCFGNPAFTGLNCWKKAGPSKKPIFSGLVNLTIMHDVKPSRLFQKQKMKWSVLIKIWRNAESQDQILY